MPRKSVAGTSADPIVDYVDLQLGDQTYHLCWDFNSIAQAESETGLNMLSAPINFETITAVQLRALFFAVLLEAQPEMTLQETGKLMRPPDLAAITKATLQAWNKAWPDEDATEKNGKAPDPPKS